MKRPTQAEYQAGLNALKQERREFWGDIQLDDGGMPVSNSKPDYTISYQVYTKVYYKKAVEDWIKENGTYKAPPYSKLLEDARRLAEIHTVEAINRYSNTR